MEKKVEGGEKKRGVSRRDKQMVRDQSHSNPTNSPSV